MFIGYFDETKRNITVEDQKSIVDSYINEHKINLDIVLSSSDFGSIFENINTPKHTIIVSNITCLGNKLERINANFKKLLPLKLELISVKENLHLKSDENLSAMIEGINLAIKIRSSMTSTITRQALNKKREQGYIDLIKKLRNEGYTNREIAKQLNVHPVWLGKKIKQLELPPPEKKQERNSAMKGHDEELKQMYQSGVLLKDIGEHFGVKYNTVIYRLTKLGIYQPYKNKGVA